MGFWRTLYYFIGVEYIGKKEQALIDRQKHLKYVACKQIEAGGIKLKKENFITKNIKKNKKKNFNNIL
jgi:hypothetical protein